MNLTQFADQQAGAGVSLYSGCPLLSRKGVARSAGGKGVPLTPATGSVIRKYLLPLLFLINTAVLHADGGTVWLRERAGAYQVTVFTSPTPFRAGPTDVSVLLQDAATGESVTCSPLMIRLTNRSSHRVIEQRATTEAATNKLYQAALFVIPEPGWWEVEVLIEGSKGVVKVRFAIKADQPLPRWQELWYWYCWPALAVVLFGVHQLLMLRRRQLSQVEHQVH